MATLSNNDIARAIYLLSKDKTQAQLRDTNGKIVNFLFRRRLLSETRDILERLDKIINYENRTVEAKVSTARKLRGKFKKELLSFLKKRYRAKGVILAEKLDEELLGGVRVEVNDEVINLTVRNKINELQEHLVGKI